MTFAIDRRLRAGSISLQVEPWKAPSAVQISVMSAEILAKREASCRSCPRFLVDIERCMSKDCGCPASANRLQPWKNLRWCGEKRW